MNIALAHIGQISVTVHDLSRSIAFYRDTLGVKHLFSSGNMAFFECGEVRLMLAIPEKPEFDHPSSILYFKVDNIEDLANELAGRGVAFESMPHLVARLPDHELWMGFFRDSESNVLALMCEKPTSANLT